MSTSGAIGLGSVLYKVDVDHASEQVPAAGNANKIIITDLQGEILAEHTRPAPGIRHVGNGRRPGTRPKNPEPSPKS